MHYFGVPTCPYCKKRVNIIRTWSLKRQGEYQCPRCGGISNIFLSPLVYVMALLAVFSGGAMYFFHKFVLDDISLETAIYVFVPFAIFFLLSLFTVYLEKPVIKKVSKEEYHKKRSIRSAVDGSAGAVSRPDERRGYHEEDYVPRGSYRPGPEAPRVEQPRQGVVNQAAFTRAKRQAAVENTQQSQRLSYPGPSAPQPQRQRDAVPVQAVNQSARPQAQARAPQPRTAAAPRTAQPTAQQKAYNQQAARQRPVPGRTAQEGRVVGSGGAPAQNSAYAGRYPEQGVPQRGVQGQDAHRDMQ